MIKTKSGQEVKIIAGNKKCITGKGVFTVKCVYPELTMEEMFTQAGQIAMRNRTEKSFRLTKRELVYDSEDELYTAIGYKKVKE